MKEHHFQHDPNVKYVSSVTASVTKNQSGSLPKRGRCLALNLHCHAGEHHIQCQPCDQYLSSVIASVSGDLSGSLPKRGRCPALNLHQDSPLNQHCYAKEHHVQSKPCDQHLSSVIASVTKDPIGSLPKRGRCLALNLHQDSPIKRLLLPLRKCQHYPAEEWHIPREPNCDYMNSVTAPVTKEPSGSLPRRGRCLALKLHPE